MLLGKRTRERLERDYAAKSGPERARFGNADGGSARSSGNGSYLNSNFLVFLATRIRRGNRSPIMRLRSFSGVN